MQKSWDSKSTSLCVALAGLPFDPGLNLVRSPTDHLRTEWDRAREFSGADSAVDGGVAETDEPAEFGATNDSDHAEHLRGLETLGKVRNRFSGIGEADQKDYGVIVPSLRASRIRGLGCGSAKPATRAAALQ